MDALLECKITDTLYDENLICPACEHIYDVYMRRHTCPITKFRCAGAGQSFSEVYAGANVPIIAPDGTERPRGKPRPITCARCTRLGGHREPTAGECPKCKYAGFWLHERITAPDGTTRDDPRCPACINTPSSNKLVTEQPRAQVQAPAQSRVCVRKPAVYITFNIDSKELAFVLAGAIDGSLPYGGDNDGTSAAPFPERAVVQYTVYDENYQPLAHKQVKLLALDELLAAYVNYKVTLMPPDASLRLLIKHLAAGQRLGRALDAQYARQIANW